ncbi:MAG: type III pantothenate kinase [Gammaproteobacteria bacterium]|nr:type III pantothenate kinase [Gammaproteobacteria bacterium]MCI0590102.1 type III pantothenate kinase [Gammaproteobacteria bacterium]
MLVDIGNSRIKWGNLTQGELVSLGTAPYDVHKLPRLLNERWEPLTPPSRIMVSNVAGSRVADVLQKWTAATWAIDPEFVAVQRKGFGVTNGYREYRRLGVDRWVALIGAWHRYKAPTCVVDCGTAITIDALAGSGEHLGGLIIPGLRMMQLALTEHTHGISGVVTGDISRLARDTDDGVASGCHYAAAAFIDRIVCDLMDDLGISVHRIITGGSAVALLPLLQNEFEYDKDLVLRGLAVIANSDR